jgi:hypothetical protein
MPSFSMEMEKELSLGHYTKLITIYLPFFLSPPNAQITKFSREMEKEKVDNHLLTILFINI